MSTFVLVHGAWRGGWCWRKVAPLLAKAGHAVYTPTLTGLGERAHLLTENVCLDTHIADIANVLEFEDLHEVILVGHSYGGMVIAGVAEQAAARLAHIVFLDAFVPLNGSTNMELIGGGPPPLMDDGWRVPPATANLAIPDEADRAWLVARLRPQSRLTFEQPVSIAGKTGGEIPRTFILCRQAPRHVVMAGRLRKDDTWRVRELDTGHDAMITAAPELTELLLECATFPTPAC